MPNTSRAIKHQNLIADHYYTPWSEVSEAMQQEWLKTNTLPGSTRAHHQQERVSKLDATYGEEISVYQTIDEAITKLGVSRFSLRNAINDRRELRGFKVKYTDTIVATTEEAI
ncbi:hypothetical protein JKP88DRAFT_251674 [Tribonema minus]|uniref:Uncharacterized protein n=1 Tax=Tribonema minus TaxID=303371 RepID=A0A835ZM70_9STRA|nr:hypothetical protein JKP88DRAFT_251674 [Tribonema minus]